jgi:hypothetical protein
LYNCFFRPLFDGFHTSDIHFFGDLKKHSLSQFCGRSDQNRNNSHFRGNITFASQLFVQVRARIFLSRSPNNAQTPFLVLIQNADPFQTAQPFADVRIEFIQPNGNQFYTCEGPLLRLTALRVLI